MAKTSPWRVKGIDRKTRRMAREAAARSGVPIGVWIDRAIKARAAIVPRGDVKPLVPPELISSVRTAGKAESQPSAPADRRDHPVPARIEPAAASRWPARLGAGHAIAAALVVGLTGGGYWLVAIGPVDAPVGSEQRAATGSRATPPDPAALTPVQKLIAAANGGDAAAQNEVGLMYLEGQGVAKNPSVGAQWLEKSATAGLAKAQYHLGILYEKGLGVPRNEATALSWYRRAAEQGHARAQHNLATLYAEGKGTPRDYAEAMQWFSRAAKAGLAESHFSLGMMHEHGLGVEKDARKAAAFYREALAAGSAMAADKLARLEPALQGTPAAPVATETAVAPASGGAQAVAADGTLTASGIISLQRLLARLDLEPGPPNGVVGQKTIDAIKLYQRFAGLPVDGKPTLDLLRDLRQVVSAMSAEPTPQPAPGGKP